MTTAFVLAGGGSLGTVQVGMLQALSEREVGLVWLDDPPQTAEVGYVFDPESGGQAFATEAVAALVHAAFDAFDFNLVVAKTDEAKPSAMRRTAFASRDSESQGRLSLDPPVKFCPGSGS